MRKKRNLPRDLFFSAILVLGFIAVDRGSAQGLLAQLWPGDNEITTTITAPSTAAVVGVAWWPNEIPNVGDGTEVQFYQATLLSDGLRDCTVPPPAPGALYESGSFVGGCDSAMALLSLLPQEAYVRFHWGLLANATAFDSMFYSLRVRRAVDDSTIFANAVMDTLFDWRVGDHGAHPEVDQVYDVSVRGHGWWKGSEQQGPWSALVEFGFPSAPVPLQIPPVVVDTTVG